MSKKITDLDPATSVSDGDQLEVVVVGPPIASKRATVAQLRGTPYITLQSEGVPLGQYHTINFVGTPVDVIQTSPGVAQVSVAGGGAGVVDEPYTLSTFWNGTMPEYRPLLLTVIPITVAFAINFAGSFAKAAVAATVETEIYVYKNGTWIGTITFAAGSQNGTFFANAAVTFVPGDILKIETDYYPDATLADVVITLLGTR